MLVQKIKDKGITPLLCIAVTFGLFCRFNALDKLPPWTDEIATMIYSLGNNFLAIPPNEIITDQQLLQPLVQNPAATLGSVWHNLMTYSTHPPLYFWLCHLWIALWAEQDQILNIWVARSLSALLGLVVIITIAHLGRRVSRSPRVMGYCALLATLSPFGIFLSRQARHYTLGLIWVSLALTCLVFTLEQARHAQKISQWLVGAWISINTLGMATHYFFVLSIVTQGSVVLVTILRDRTSRQAWKTFLVVAIGSFLAILVWVPAIQSANGTSPTDWLYNNQVSIEPIIYLMLWMMGMVTMLPTAITTVVPLWLTIVSGVVMVAFFIWLLLRCWQVLKLDISPSLQVIISYLLISLSLFLVVHYGLGVAITVAPRFSFLWFPAWVVVLGVAFSRLVQPWVIAGITTMIMVGSLITMLDLGYLQHERVDLLARFIAEETQTQNPLIATHLHQKARLMGIAWEFRDWKKYSQGMEPEFLLATSQHRQESDGYRDALAQLDAVVSARAEGTELWLVRPNDAFKGHDWSRVGCSLASRGRVGELSYRLLRCHFPGD